MHSVGLGLVTLRSTPFLCGEKGTLEPDHLTSKVGLGLMTLPSTLFSWEEKVTLEPDHLTSKVEDVPKLMRWETEGGARSVQVQLAMDVFK